MKKGAYMLIFFFWAFLTIITPTLVQWSAATSAGSQSEEYITGKEGLTRARKMMELIQEIQWRKAPPRPAPELEEAVLPPPPPPPSPPLAPPAPAPEEDERAKKAEVVREASSKQVFMSRRLLQRW